MVTYIACVRNLKPWVPRSKYYPKILWVPGSTYVLFWNPVGVRPPGTPEITQALKANPLLEDDTCT